MPIIVYPLIKLKNKKFNFLVIYTFSFLFILQNVIAENSPKVLEIELDGEVDIKTRIALSRVFNPNSVESFINPDETKVETIDNLCKSIDCKFNVTSKNSKDFIELTKKIKTTKHKPSLFDPQESTFQISYFGNEKPNEKPYVFIKRESDILKGFHNKNINDDYFAIPISTNRFNAAISNSQEIITVPALSNKVSDKTNILAWFSNTTSSNNQLNLLNNEVKEFGSTNRQFVIPDNTSTEDLKYLIELASKNPSINIKEKEKGSYYISSLENEIIQNGDIGNCKDTKEDWPYDVKIVEKTLIENNKYFKQIGINHFNKTNILIIDNGIGKKLYEDKSFFRFLSADIDKLLFPNFFHNKSIHINERICSDKNSPPFFAYGYSPDYEHYECANMSHLERLIPLASNDPNHYLGHGSFVSTLAIGGTELFYKYNQLSDMIGLKIARYTYANKQRLSISTDSNDLKNAIIYGAKSESGIINISLNVSKPKLLSELIVELRKIDGLIIAAAGNKGNQLNSSSPQFPASTFNSMDNLIVVGAAERDSKGNIKLWSKSAHSDKGVDIAAPGVEVLSFDHTGNEVCTSGTSASAPLVSFVAAILQSYGYKYPNEIRRRILATASIEPKLLGKVVDARFLDIPSALNIFFDQIWLNGSNTPKKGFIVGSAGFSSKNGFLAISICDANDELLKTSSGFFDISTLQLWKRNKNKAKIWYNSYQPNDENQECEISTEKIEFFDIDNKKTIEYSLDQITRIVPTRYRESIIKIRSNFN